MESNYGIDEDVSSLLFTSSTICYMIVINLVPILTKKYQKKYIMLVGLISCVIGIIIISPFTDIGISDKWWVVIVGLPFIGVSNAFCVLP